MDNKGMKYILKPLIEYIEEQEMKRAGLEREPKRGRPKMPNRFNHMKLELS
jgi:hypothetical protein